MVLCVFSVLVLGHPPTAGAHTDPTASASGPLPASPTPAVPIVTPAPLPISPPQIVSEAGVLPGGVLGGLDRFAELLDRTLFSFGLPSLRARVALTQAAERVAELQALERDGTLTLSALHGLLASHARLIEIGSSVVARQVAAGRQPTALLVLLVRTRLAAAQVLHEVQEQRALEEADTTLRELTDAIDALVDLEGDLLPPDTASVAPAVLHVFAEQKIALAERELLAALFVVEERLAHRRVVIADAELRAAAESLLVTARELSAAGNDREALALATAVRGVIARLASETIVVEPEHLLSEGGSFTVTEILDGLVEEGIVGLPERATAELRAHQVAEQLRRDASR